MTRGEMYVNWTTLVTARSRDTVDTLLPRRRPPTGGYARGDLKRLKIVQAALRRFGEEGFERASTRQIAQDAGVNPPALQYYFDGKEGLHLACAEYIAERLSGAMQSAYRRAEQVGADRIGALDALCDILDALADFLFETSEADGWSSFMARGHGEEGKGPAYEALRRIVRGELDSHCNRLVGLITGHPPSDPRTRIRSLALLGQIRAFHLGRDGALERLGWPDLRGPRLQMLKEVIRAQTRAALAPEPR
jgi:AcrR family transcriptional regulator